MKKLLSIVLGLSLLILCSCGNRAYFDFEHDTYKHLHCFETGKCYNIESWKDMKVGIKITTKEYGILYFSEGTYMLVGEKCPICNK